MQRGAPEASEAEEGTRRWRVRGRVQGVGFRWWAMSVARELDLAGTVRNLPDGSVDIAASGETGALHRFRDSVARGPTGARVDALEELDPPAGPLPKPFEIAR